jgi:hypothetical protein
MTPIVRIRPRAILWALLTINALLVTGYLVTRYAPTSSRAIQRWFDLGAEASIPPWYNGSLLLVAGLLALLRGAHLRAANRRSHWKAYLIAAAGLVFLSADEVAQIHETVSGTMHRRAAADEGVMSHVEAWDIVTFVLYAGAALGLFALLRRDVLAALREPRGRAPLLAGGLTFVAGAVLIDQLNLGLPERVRVALEDGMELTGATLMLYGLLLKLGTLTVTVGGNGADAGGDGHAAPMTPKVNVSVAPRLKSSLMQVDRQPVETVHESATSR